MSTGTLTRHEQVPTTTLPGLHVSFPGVVRSEWTKFRSLRSTLITLGVAVFLTVGIGALVAGVQANHWPQASPQDRAGFNPVSVSLSGVYLAQLAVGVLGVLLVSGEYATGMIRTSLVAVPRRLPVLWAKLGVFAGVTAVASIVSVFAAFFIGQSLLSSQHIQASLSTSGALQMVVGAALFLLLVGVIGMALGALMRNTAAGISTLVALFFVLPPIMQLLPKSWSNHIAPYLPANAGEAIWAHPDTVHLSAWAGMGVLGLWAVAAVAAAAYGLVRRDA